MKISRDKKYKTKTGILVTIYCTDAQDDPKYPVVGRTKNGDVLRRWTLEGKSSYDTSYDLVEIKKAEEVAKDAFRKAIERNDITSVYDNGELIGKITLSSCVSPKLYDECIEFVVASLREAGMLREDN